MHILLNKAIEEKALQKFVKQINEVEDKSDIKIYLSSGGGNPAIVPMFKFIIEQHKIPLIAYEYIKSAALDLFLNTNTPRSVLGETYGMYHRTTIGGVYLDINLKPILDDGLKEIYQTEAEHAITSAKFLQFDEEQMKKVDEGKEIYVNTKQLREALLRSEKFFNKNILENLVD